MNQTIFLNTVSLDLLYACRPNKNDFYTTYGVISNAVEDLDF